MRVASWVCLCVLGGAASAAQANILRSSGFDAGLDGWRTLNGATDASFVAAGGDPGGFITATEGQIPGRAWVWDAPSGFGGDWSSAVGGTLNYSLKVDTTLGSTEDVADVKLIGTGLTVVADAGLGPGLDWTRYSVLLAPGVWHLDSLDGALASAEQLGAVLADVVDLRIRGEYSPIATDSGSLDSVFVSATPEPQTWALWLAGLAAVGSLARRRR